ncbi:hypothetical protein [Streptomyces chartreusis]|uniref:Uncharacterized protein n=1 Tax=Streptomyces chartreusis TaxID=1969 RepID=A0A7H8T543_STRCX|nr:hypothetical protein [Streptomyces chartreusis]QKZ18593.1 hypothetical protein HUT05_15165 [Streptomyces chartreusis]
MPENTFGHVASDTAVRTGLLQTGTCNLAPMPETEDTTAAPAPENAA